MEEVPDNFSNKEVMGETEGNEVDKTINVELTVEKPAVGMSFSSVNDLLEFYARYGKELGFGICKRSSTKDDNGDVKYLTIVCSLEGKVRRTSKSLVNMRPISKTDCKARITAALRLDGKWIITSTILGHNHGLSPSKSRFHRCNRKLTPKVKRRLETNDESDISLNKSINSFVFEAKGHENLSYLEKDCRNHVEKFRRLQLGEGDANAMHNYFLKMQTENSEFFHTMDLDDEGQLRNVFWADGRCRAACKEFGDVITFDATYLADKYDMPFAPFVEVNHHGQSVLLGCGLISSEDTKT